MNNNKKWISIANECKFLRGQYHYGVSKQRKILIYGQFKILWLIDPLLGNDHETNNEKTAVAKQRPTLNNGSTAGGGVSSVVRSEAILSDRRISVQAEDVRGLNLAVVKLTTVQVTKLPL
jgi:hypothetical protein